MDLLVVDTLDTDVMEWLGARHRVVHAPQLAGDTREFRRSLYNVRCAIVPGSLTVDEETLSFAPVLRAIGRVSPGPESIDAEACERRGVEIVRNRSASDRAEAEFAIGAMLALLRRAPVHGADGSVMGRELGGASIGLVGMPPSARTIAQLLSGFGARIFGYDPSLHASDTVWPLWQVAPSSLPDLVERCDVLCVQLPYFTRYQGLLGERFLSRCKPGQVLVSTVHSGLFDEAALARALKSGRIAAAWLDSLEPGALDPDRPLHGIETLQVTPCIASTTREARQRAAWTVAQRIDALLAVAPLSGNDFIATVPGDLSDLEAESRSP